MTQSRRVQDRNVQARDVRHEAAELAYNREHPVHRCNAEEQRYRHPSNSPLANRPSYLATFTKGFPHNRNTGLVSNPDDVQAFISAIDSGNERDIADLNLGPGGKPESRFTSGIAREHNVTKARAWESQGAGHTFDLEGPDAQSVTMPPAPTLDSPELAAEMTELYYMALVRDVNFTDFAEDRTVDDAIAAMNRTEWVGYATNPPPRVTDAEKGRLRGPFTADNLFRGITPGDDVGPYISQFLLVGSKGIANGNDRNEGYIQYGGHRIDQRVRFVQRRDYMTTWLSWLDAQNGADLRGTEIYMQNTNMFRFITSPRDLATYVHFDALYQAYLNACLILLAEKVPFDAGLPFTAEDSIDKQQGFATFGGPHILTLVTEVATRALKAVRFQKYNVHRRLRPEAVGGLIERYHNAPRSRLFRGVGPLYNSLGSTLLNTVARHNMEQNTLSDGDISRQEDCSAPNCSDETRLLPMAFPEGSPMHPSYGAGHATVAGACVTVLKAFFDHGWELPFAYVPSDNGKTLEAVQLDKPLTVEGELNKVCSNISIGRSFAGVHYFGDYIESARLGEKIAIGLLEEQKLTYHENFSMTVPLFDGTVYRI